jgi:hypothetical protein
VAQPDLQILIEDIACLAISKKVDVVFIVGSRELDPTYDDPIFFRVTSLAQPELQSICFF